MLAVDAAPVADPSEEKSDILSAAASKSFQVDFLGRRDRRDAEEEQEIEDPQSSSL